MRQMTSKEIEMFKEVRFRFDKIVLGIVESVDVEKGKMKVRVGDVSPGVEIDVDISFPAGAGIRGCIFRMPKRKDFVLLGFRPGGVAEVIGYKICNWEELYKEEGGERVFDKNFYWRVMSEGDIWLVTEGLGELYISDSGDVYIASKFVSDNLLGQIGLRRMSAKIYEINSVGSKIRFGSVLRVIAGIPRVIMEGLITLKEFLVDIVSSVGLKLVELKYGDVVDDLGVREVSLKGRFLRHRCSVYNEVGLEVLRYTIDAGGNIVIDFIDGLGEVEIKFSGLTFVKVNKFGVEIGYNPVKYSFVRGEELVKELQKNVVALEALRSAFVSWTPSQQDGIVLKNLLTGFMNSQFADLSKVLSQLLRVE